MLGSVGRPSTRGMDDLVETAVSWWIQAASKRGNWMSMGRSMVNSGRPMAYMMIMILNSSNLIFDSDKAIQV